MRTLDHMAVYCDVYSLCHRVLQRDCRKPHPGMLKRAAREHGLELAGSYVIGERYADVEMAEPIAARSILVPTGYGRGEYELYQHDWPRQPYGVAENLSAAVDLIFEELS